MIYYYPDIPWDVLGNVKSQPRPKGNPGGRKKTKWKNMVSAFDIECSTLPDVNQAFMYIWQWQFGPDITVIGRTWLEFLELCTYLSTVCEEHERWMIFIHNASYEFQFIAGIYDFAEEDVFAVDFRKVLKFTIMDHLEFRCSYLHSNMSLDEFTRKMGAEHQKLSGDEFDYSKIRYPWTELTHRELEYCCNDVIGLVEAITIEMERDGETFYSYPLTSTGYPRRDVKTSMRTYNKQSLARQLPTYEVYKMLRQGFRGGDVHANRYYVGQVLEDVDSADRSSSYPSNQLNDPFPMGQWCVEKDVPWERFEELIGKRHKAAILEIAIYGPIRLKHEDWGAPYLTVDKCRNKLFPLDEKGRELWGCKDNGRILFAEYLETTVTDVDLRIILNEYDFEAIHIIKMAHATYGKLPGQFTEPVLDYYRKKTELKDVDGREWEYMKSKNKLNAIYGMSVQDPVKDLLLFTYGGDQGGFEFKGRDKKGQLQEEYRAQLLAESNRKAFTAYSWGVWTSAWARWHLHQLIQLVYDTPGCEFIYCDTDSVKYIGKMDLEKYNARMRKESRKNKAYATDPKGKIHYMGVFEQETRSKFFVTLGAKKYAYIPEGSDHIKLTLAGVNKEKGALELEKAGGLAMFKEGFTFTEGAGTESIYNDEKEPIPPVMVDGHELKITRNVVIRPSTYTLGVTGEYGYILDHPDIWRKLLDADGIYDYN